MKLSNNMRIISIGNIGGYSSTWVKDKVTINIIGYFPYETTTKRVFLNNKELFHGLNMMFILKGDLW